MEQRARLKARIDSITALQDVVRAMKSVSAVHMQQAEHAVTAVRHYADIIGTAFTDALALLDAAPPAEAAVPDGRRVILVFCSEHGFVGAMNDALLDAAVAALGAQDALVLVGARGASLAAERGLGAAWQGPMPTHVAGAAAHAREIVAALLTKVQPPGIDELHVLHARARALGRWTIDRDRLLPPDLDRFSRPAPGSPPLVNLPGPALLDRLGEEQLLAAVTLATMEALLSESAARFAAMSAAHDNIERKLADLRLRESQLRQEEITIELLDVVTGGQAVLGG